MANVPFHPDVPVPLYAYFRRKTIHSTLSRLQKDSDEFLIMFA